MRGIANVKINMRQTVKFDDPAPPQQHIKTGVKSALARENVARNTSV